VIHRFLDVVDDTIGKFFGEGGNRRFCLSPQSTSCTNVSEQSRNMENKYQKRVITSSANVWQGSIICVWRSRSLTLLPTFWSGTSTAACGACVAGQTDRFGPLIVHVWEWHMTELEVRARHGNRGRWGKATQVPRVDVQGRVLPQIQGRDEAQHRASRVKSRLLLAVLQRQAVDDLHGVPTKATCAGIFEALENPNGDHQLAAEYHSQLKAEIHLVGPAKIWTGAVERILTVRSPYQATRAWRHSWHWRLGMSHSYL
jgi:hypothetical protein